MNELGIETMADLDAATRDPDTLFVIEDVLNRWLEKWKVIRHAVSKEGESHNRRVETAGEPSSCGWSCQRIWDDVHICGDGKERYPGKPMVETDDGAWNSLEWSPGQFSTILHFNGVAQKWRSLRKTT